MRATKFLMVMFAVTFATVAQAQNAWPDSCGKDAVQFKVKTDKHAAAPAGEQGKAQIVFVESLKGPFMTPPTARIAVDGNWVAADRGNSYSVFSVAPGMHHLCASRQSSVKADKENVGVVTIDVEAGKVYYYEFRILRTEVEGTRMRADGGAGGAGGGGSSVGNTPNMTLRDMPTIDTVDFSALSPSEGKDRTRSLPLSTFSVK